MMKKLFIMMAVLILVGANGMCDYSSDRLQAYTLYTNSQYASSQKAYEKIIIDYPQMRVQSLAESQLMIGYSLLGQKKYIEAQSAFEKVMVIANYPLAVNQTSIAQLNIGYILRTQGKFQEAQSSFIKAAIGYGFINLKFQEKVWKVIDPVYLDKESYQHYLQKLLMIVPATEENAEFLGKIKSQLELLK